MASDAHERAQARCDPNSGIFKLISWDELGTIIASNDLSLLTRSPSQLHDYEDWKRETLARYGSIERYMLQVRLQWTEPITPVSQVPFEHPKDWKCLPNDFPYGLDPSITHLVIWLKPKLPVSMETDNGGQLSREAIQMVEKFLGCVFWQVEKDDLLYFMNPKGLKSIGNLEHFHVLLRNQTNVEKYYDEEKR